MNKLTPPPSSSPSSSSVGQIPNAEAVEILVKFARQEIEDGVDDPSQALAALLHAIKLTQGEDAIVGVLDQVNKAYKDFYGCSNNYFYVVQGKRTCTT